MMSKEKIKKKLEEVEKQLEIIPVDLINFDYYDKLLDIHTKLYALMYFKVNQEEGFLLK